MKDEIIVNYNDGYGWGVATDIKAAEHILSLYKETGEEFQRERAEKLADRLAEKVGANPRRQMSGIG